jgi:carotenoid cleavage dioxygenase-like enzyme
LITEHFQVILETSVLFDVSGIMEGNFFSFHSEAPFRIGLLPKQRNNSSEIQWFVFNQSLSLIHGLNAFEEYHDPLDSQKVTDVMIHAPVSDHFNGFDPKNISVTNLFHMAMLHIDVIHNTTSIHYYSNTLHSPRVSRSDDNNHEMMEKKEVHVEFPNMHPRYIGQRAQYGFVGGFHVNDYYTYPDTNGLEKSVLKSGFSYLVKVNMLENRFQQLIRLPEEITVFEPIVIPKFTVDSVVTAKLDQSDAVYVVAFGYNHLTEEAEWFAYDGESMDSEPVLRLKLGGKRVNLGFHGVWLSKEWLKQHYQLPSTAA